MFVDFIKKVFNIQERTLDIDLFTLASQELKRKIEKHQVNSLYFVTEYEKEKLNTLKEIGLVNSDFVVDTEKEIATIEEINRIGEVVNHFRKEYPHNPFILYSQAKRICTENNFVFCSAPTYTKNIPDSNYAEVKNFKLKDEDKCYYGVSSLRGRVIGISDMQVPNEKGFEISNKEIYEKFNKRDGDFMFFNKKWYYDNFPTLICTQPHNLIEKKSDHALVMKGLKTKYNIQQGHTLILKPVYRNNIYGFLIITVIKDTETNEQSTRKKRTNW